MTCFYPLFPQSDYTELKFSLRSVEKYLQPDEVVIAGVALPEWITDVTQLKIKDFPSKKQLNIRRKIYAGLEYAKELVFMSDDVYLLSQYSGLFYSSGLLTKHGENGARVAEEKLKELGKLIKDCDVHCPITYDQRFKEVMPNFLPGSVIKSVYVNYLELPTVEMWDCKVNKKMGVDEIKRWLNGRPYFSTGSAGITSALPVLEELFPLPSKYELF